MAPGDADARPVVSGPGVRIFEIAGYISSLFLAEHDDGRLLLLDAGTARDFATVEAAIPRVTGGRRRASDLDLVVATHAHPDHMGAALAWRQRYGTRVAAPARVGDW